MNLSKNNVLYKNYQKAKSLGEIVHVKLGQSSVIQVNANGVNEIYFHSNGVPGTFSVLQAQTGKLTFSQEIPGTEAVWAMTTASDKNVYFASTSNGELYQYCPILKKVKTVGINPSGKWVWSLSASDDGKLYGVTYPQAGVFEYCIYTNRFKDFGSISNEAYARGVGVDKDFVYVGVGTKKHLYRINRTTDKIEEIYLEGYTNQPGTIEDIYSLHNKLCISVSTTEMIIYNLTTKVIENHFFYNNKISEPSPFDPNIFYYKYEDKLFEYNIMSNQSREITDIPKLPDTLRVNEMKWIELNNQTIVLAIITQHGEYFQYDPILQTITFISLAISETFVAIQSLFSSKDGNLYLGGYQRGMTIYDPINKIRHFNFPTFPQSEGIGELAETIFFGTYTRAKMYAYQKQHPIVKEDNPKLIYEITNNQDRPFAITSNEHQLFVGTVPDYGLLGGSLIIYDSMTDTWEQFDNIIRHHSIASLTYHDGLLYGTTSIYGGLGIEPDAANAKIFIWDIVRKKVVQSFTPYIPGEESIPLLGEIIILENGNILSVSDKHLFILDGKTYQIIKTQVLKEANEHISKWFAYRLIYGPDGVLYATFGRKIVAIDIDTLDYQVLDENPTNNLAIGPNGSIYFTSDKELYVIDVPETDATVSEILIENQPLAHFSSAKEVYSINRSFTDDLTIKTNQVAATIQVDHNQIQTKIYVTATDLITKKTYCINWGA